MYVSEMNRFSRDATMVPDERNSIPVVLVLSLVPEACMLSAYLTLRKVQFFLLTYGLSTKNFVSKKSRSNASIYEAVLSGSLR